MSEARAELDAVIDRMNRENAALLAEARDARRKQRAADDMVVELRREVAALTAERDAANAQAGKVLREWHEWLEKMLTGGDQ